MTYRNPRWHPFEWRLIATAVLFALVWYFVSSSLFYRPTAVEIDGYQVTVTREFPLSPPFDEPFIEYHETVRALNSAEPICTDSAAFRYHDNGSGVATWNIESWAARCMEGDYIWSAHWKVKLWTVIPLRPVEMQKIFKRQKPQLQIQLNIGGKDK